MPAREGTGLVVGVVVVAVLLFALALRMRSWPLWLLAFATAVVALVMAWVFRDPSRAVDGSAVVALLPRP